MSELHKYLAAYDEDDQDRTPSDFTTVRLAQGRIAQIEAEIERLAATLRARTDALGRVAETNQRLRDEIHDRENTEQDVRARLADAERRMAEAEWLIRTDHSVGRHDQYGAGLTCKGCAWLSSEVQA